jgi:hypothetical protein
LLRIVDKSVSVSVGDVNVSAELHSLAGDEDSAVVFSPVGPGALHPIIAASAKVTAYGRIRSSPGWLALLLKFSAYGKSKNSCVKWFPTSIRNIGAPAHRSFIDAPAASDIPR